LISLVQLEEVRRAIDELRSDSPGILILDGQHDYDQRQSQENERHEKAMHRHSDE
jgi:hypothetical protein